MTLLRTHRFSLRLLTASDAQLGPRSDILVEGKSTGKAVSGAVFEAAYSWNGRYLLFITDDIPNEETLHIYLLDSDLNVRDWARLGAMYSTGHLSALEPEQPNVVHFRFFGDTVWTISLLPAPVFHLPLIADPRGVRRPLRLTREFALSGNPRPEPRNHG